MRKGQEVPQALREQIASKLRGRPAVQNIGLVRSAETRAKIAASLTGKTHSEETKAKMRASQAARRAANPVSAETKAKVSAALMGRPKSDAARAAMSAAKKGKPGRKLTEEERLKRIAQRRAAPKVQWSEESKAKISGTNSCHYGKPPRHKPRIEYKGVLMRSTWEKKFARACDDRGIIWRYEPVRFDLGDSTYAPDFYLPELKVFWEVKGWLDSASQEKICRFRKLYPEIPLVVATKPILQLFGAL